MKKKIESKGWQDGLYWIHLAPGWYSIETETHSINGLTKKEAMDGMSMVERCNCQECLEQLKKKG